MRRIHDGSLIISTNSCTLSSASSRQPLSDAVLRSSSGTRTEKSVFAPNAFFGLGFAADAPSADAIARHPRQHLGKGYATSAHAASAHAHRAVKG